MFILTSKRWVSFHPLQFFANEVARDGVGLYEERVRFIGRYGEKGSTNKYL
jgi:hypothetical protein